HPFYRPFNENTYEEEQVVRFIKPYTATGPFGDPPTYHWRAQDFLQALLGAGFTLCDYRDMQSYEDDLSAYSWVDKSKYDWTVYPYSALPSWQGMSAKKL
ncbi:MAG: hypothetical protein LBK23_11190, partial [Oscillospiraceae bacterium]|nr:hypothetical protein [Oscillospiraceae bacterium]